MKKDRPRVSDGSGGRGTETALRGDRERNCNLKWREWEEGKEGAPSLIAPSLARSREGWFYGRRSVGGLRRSRSSGKNYLRPSDRPNGRRLPTRLRRRRPARLGAGPHKHDFLSFPVFSESAFLRLLSPFLPFHFGEGTSLRDTKCPYPLKIFNERSE